MTVQEKTEAARESLGHACANLCDYPSDPNAWRAVCSAKARLVALLNCGGF